MGTGYRVQGGGKRGGKGGGYRGVGLGGGL